MEEIQNLMEKQKAALKNIQVSLRFKEESEKEYWDFVGYKTERLYRPDKLIVLSKQESYELQKNQEERRSVGNQEADQVSEGEHQR